MPAADTNAAVNWQDFGTSRWQLALKATPISRGAGRGGSARSSVGDLRLALIVVVITEMISSADGLGYQVIYALSSLKTDRMLALVVVIALLGWLLDRALVALRDRLVYWEKLETYYV